MATSIGNLNVILSANTAAFAAGLKAAEKSVVSLGAAVEGSTAGIGASYGKLVGIVAGVGAAIGAVKLTSWGFEVAAQAEKMQAAFEVMLGNADDAKRMFTDLRKFAVDTAFDLQGASEAALQLFNAGAGKAEVIPLLRIIGDQASASAKGLQEGSKLITKALADIKAKGKLSAQEINQLAESGIGARQMVADRLGISVAEMMKRAETTGIDSSVALEAILQGMQAKTFGLMDKQAKTLQGRWASLKEAAGNLLGDVAAEFATGAGLRGMLGDVSGWIESIRPSVQAFGRSLGEVVRAAYDVTVAVKDISNAAAALLTINLAGFLPGTDQTRTWRASTIDAVEAAAKTFAAFGDQTIAVFAELELAYTQFLVRFHTGVLEYKRAMVQFTYYASEAIRDQVLYALNTELAKASAIQAKLQARIDKQKADAANQTGPAQRQVGDFFKDFRKAENLRIANELADEFVNLASSAFDWSAAVKTVVKDLAFVKADMAGLAGGFGGDFLKGAVESGQKALHDLDRLASSVMSELDKPAPTAGALARGSEAAYSLLVQRDMGQGNTQDRIAAAVEEMKRKASEQTKLQQQIRDELKRAGVLKVADDNFNG